MLNAVFVDLSPERNWDPVRLTAESFRWPIDAAALPLDVLCLRVAASSFAEVGAPVITPASLDSVSGSVRRRSRKYQGMVYQVGAELEEGDVLVPRSPETPVLIVSERLQGSLVSSTFTALRPVGPASALWIWGVLNSVSGRTLREHHASVGLLVGESLLGLAIPVPGAAMMERLGTVLQRLESATHTEEEESAGTWWRTTDIRGAAWHLMLATPTPELLDQGVPLRDLCEITRGRPVRAFAVEAEEPGYVVVTDITMLGGRPPRHWVPADEGELTIANGGDVLVAAKGDRPYATVARALTAADQDVYVLRMRNLEHGPAVAGFLNGQQGFAIRRMLLRGATIPSLGKRDIERMPIPPEVLDTQAEVRASEPLADQLERTLWSN